jgi:hypothetical protein
MTRLETLLDDGGSLVCSFPDSVGAGGLLDSAGASVVVGGADVGDAVGGGGTVGAKVGATGAGVGAEFQTDAPGRVHLPA